MIPDQIEAVAKALFEHDEYQGYDAETKAYHWLMRSGAYLAAARAAIAAMPTAVVPDREAIAVAIFKCAFHAADTATPELLTRRKADFRPAWEHALECANAIRALLAPSA
jgi:hypothetical protein